MKKKIIVAVIAIIAIIMVVVLFKNNTTTDDDTGYHVIINNQSVGIGSKASEIGNFNNDSIELTFDDADIIDGIILSNDEYHLDNDEYVGMSVDDLIQNHKDIYGSSISDTDNGYISGRYGISYSNNNVKVEYICVDDTVSQIIISRIFDF